jgi:hypothetical protein
MNIISKYLAVLAVGVALSAPLLYLADFAFERAHHRVEMWEKLRHSKLDTIRVETSGLRWMKPGKELLVKGSYFDVYDIRYENGWAIVTGFFDSRETDMHEAFAKGGAHEKAQGKTPSLIAHWLQKQWHQSNWQVRLSPWRSIIAKPVCFIDKQLPFRVLATPDRPPRRMVS